MSEFKLEPIGDDEIIQNSSIEAYAKLLRESIKINTFSTNVEVNFELDDLIETIGAKREKLVRLKELLEDEDIKELLDIEVTKINFIENQRQYNKEQILKLFKFKYLYFY